MKQKFSELEHDKFKQYFKIKENPWEWDIAYTNKTKKYLKFISWIPGLRMVGIWNSISMNSSSKDSDIDLFIVTTPDTMWLNRVLITLIFQILWVRKTSQKHAWRFCLSFFATTKWLNFWEFALENDIYLYFWIVYFKPILNIDNTYELFLKENSKWANFSEYINIQSVPFSIGRGLGWGLWKIKGWIWVNLDKNIKKLFLPKTIASYNKLWKPFWVIINDNMLKFHDKDIRKKIKKELSI